MSYDRTKRLLKKYSSKQPGEIWSKEASTKDQQRRRLNEYLAISDNMMDRLNMKGNQRKEVKDIIRTVKLKDLHGRASADKIILAICIYVKKIYSPKGVTWNRYSVCNEYKLSSNDFINILCNLLKYYREHSYLKCGDVGYSYDEDELEY